MVRSSRRIFFTLAGAILVISNFTLPAHASISADVATKSTVSTIAGSARLGYEDGIGKNASFSMPTGVAVMANGTVIVADSGANEIRAVSPSGKVTTLAGTHPAERSIWAQGGFANGPAAQARFNHPSGVAVEPDGTILVADTGNGCIRKIEKGIVSTFSGACGMQRNVDRGANAVHFSFPVGLTIDDRGNVYVADRLEGVRVISPSGSVTPLQVKYQDGTLGVSFGKGSNGARSLFIAHLSGLDVYNLNTKQETLYNSTYIYKLNVGIQGAVPLGYPQSVAAINDHEAVYTDAQNSTLNYINFNYVRVIAGTPRFDSGQRSTGFADGTGHAARFWAPTGVAIARDGSIIIADSGNRRIRKATAFDRHFYAQPGGDMAYMDDYAPSDHQTAIAIVGNSLSWTDTTWPDSIAGNVQKTLNARHPHAFSVIPMTSPGAPLDALTSAIQTYLSEGLAQTVVLLFNSAFATNYGHTSYQAALDDLSWQAAAVKTLKETNAALAQNGVHFVVVLDPYGYEVNPAETVRLQELVPQYSSVLFPKFEALHQAMRHTLDESGVSYFDSWDMFANDEATRAVPLFGTVDPHMNAAGRRLMADAIVRALIQNRALTGH
ncbi:MAG: hypothetical protein KGN02_08010 [bacterium]|nr:hypothetical protein [bacterium]